MMHRMRVLTILAVVSTLIGYGLNDAVFAQDATPVTSSAAGNETLVVIEHATTDTVIDLGGRATRSATCSASVTPSMTRPMRTKLA
jgi:hypothetical protein